MKKTLMTLLSLLAMTASAQRNDHLSVPDITSPQNSDAELTVNFQFDASSVNAGYYFFLEIPEGIALVDDGNGKVSYQPGDCYDGQPSITANLVDDTLKVAYIDISGNPIVGTSGTLVTFRIKPEGDVPVGTTFTGKLWNVQISDDGGTPYDLESSTFTITIGAPVENRVVLDENNRVAPDAATGVDVRVVRTIKAGNWSTLVLPFDMNADEVKYAFGDDVELAELSAWSSEEDDDGNITDLDVEFSAVSTISANTPCLIKVSADVTEFTVDNVDIEPEDEPTVQVGKKKAERGYFIGTYTAGTIVPEFNLFLSGNNFIYSVGKTTMKAYRAFFEFADVLTDVEDAAGKIRFAVTEGGATGISGVERNAAEDGSIYNLQGQRVNRVEKGVYIINGKKVLK